MLHSNIALLYLQFGYYIMYSGLCTFLEKENDKQKQE
jgi:hypothetical protein